ncbi:MAG: hypothetical protein IJR59_05110, partial [Firmicutes bacterium]|nr:hypothetical protein [Bacillota bacterium]
IKIVLTDNKGKAISESHEDVITDKDDSLWLGVLSDSTRTRDNIASIFTQYGQGYGVTRLVELSADDLEYLTSIDVLVINDFDMDSLNEDSLAIIKNRAGEGALVLIGEDGEYTDKQWFKTLVGDSVEMGYQPGGSGYSSEMSDAYDFACEVVENCSLLAYDKEKLVKLCGYLTDHELYELIYLIWYYDNRQYETASVIAERIGNVDDDYGVNDARAQINSLYESVKYFDDFKAYDYAEQMLYQSSDTTAPQKNNFSYGIESGYMTGDGVIAIAPKDELAKNFADIGFTPQTSNNGSRQNRIDYDLEKPGEIMGSIFLAVIMIYAVAIGPFLFLFLKKRDKREKAVKYIPVSALVLTAIIIVCSLGSKFQRPLANVVNLVRLGETGLRQTEGYMIVSSPAKGKINISSDSIISAVPLSNRSWDGDYETGGYSASLTEFDFTYEDQTKWSTKKYGFNGNLEVNGGIDVKLTNYNSSTDTLTMEITNNTGYDIEDLCAASNGVYNYESRLLKKFKNGETNTCDIVVSPSYGGYGFVRDRSNGYDSISSNKREVVQSLDNAQMLIVGFIKSDTSGAVKVNGRKASKEEITALYTYLNLTSEYDYAALGGGSYDTN